MLNGSFETSSNWIFSGDSSFTTAISKLGSYAGYKMLDSDAFYIDVSSTNGSYYITGYINSLNPAQIKVHDYNVWGLKGSTNYVNKGDWAFTSVKLNNMVGGVRLDASVPLGHAFFDDIRVYNLTLLGIDTLTVEQMDYWYGVYDAIKNGSTTYGFLNTLYDLFTSKANIAQETWITPTLTTATTTYLKYRKDTLGTVIIEGNLTVTTAGTNFTLPTGYRPLFAYVQGDLTFNTDGTVVSASTGLKYINVRFTGGA